MFLIRKILLLAVLLIPMISPAQNYQCVQDSTINYFTNKDHYLRAIRIDSVTTVNGNKVLYPFKTARGDYYNAALRKGGSWLGETITILPDGTHYFSNYTNDTLVIKASAMLNDSWVFYDDTSVVHYEATVTAEDTMTVLGTLDSVKTIIITAKDTAGIVVPNIYTGKVIVFSKNHGFVRCFDLYNFPSQLPHGFDYYSYKAQSMDFSLVSFHNPTTVELHDYKVGDRFQRMDYSYMYVNVAYTSLLILDKQVSGSQVTYNVLETVEKVKAVPPLGNETVMSVINIVADNRTFLDLQKLPEEWGGRVILFYNPVDEQFCYIGKYYASMPNFAYYLGDSAMINTFEPCGTSISYKLGAGIIVYAECNDPTGFNPYWYLKYVNKNNNPCGSHFTLSVDKTSAENDGIKVYPNPANNYLSIEANEIALAVDFIDVTGRVVKKVQLSNLNERVDITDISSGMFLLRFRDGMGNQTYQKLLIQH
jgi:hypothetical protein